MLDSLVNHLKIKFKVAQSDGQIVDAFYKYLLGELEDGVLNGYISHFIISNQGNPGFNEKLRSIEEGLVIYYGVKQTVSISELGYWRKDTVVFLDTEHIYSAYGLHGDLYQKVFDDLYKLVDEVSHKRKKGSGKVHLRYLQETEDSIESFFYAAEKIISNGGRAEASRSAMIELTKRCATPSDVQFEKSKLFEFLQRKKIFKEFDRDYYKKAEYILEGKEAFDALRKVLPDYYGDAQIEEALKKFTKINVIREGRDEIEIDKVKAMLVSESGIVKRISRLPLLHGGNGVIPLALNIETLTERLWFKLGKGFGANERLPASFDPVNRARIILSSQTQGNVSRQYNNLVSKFMKGELTENELARFVVAVKERAYKPEDIGEDNVDDAMSLIGDDLLGRIVSEKTHLESIANEGQKAKERLDDLYKSEQHKIRERLRGKVVSKFRFVMGGVTFLATLFFAMAYGFLR